MWNVVGGLKKWDSVVVSRNVEIAMKYKMVKEEE